MLMLTLALLALPAAEDTAWAAARAAARATAEAKQGRLLHAMIAIDRRTP